jgi:hypothetical protein
VRNFRTLLRVLVGLAATCGAQPAFALGTSREAQIGGFIWASLETIIIGEFAGRNPSQPDAQPTRPVCRANDFEDLRATGKDNASFDAFRRRCKVVEVKKNDTHVVGTAYLPAGHCDMLKQAYDKMLAEHVNLQWVDDNERVIDFTYKGARYASTGRVLAKRAQLQTNCNADGSLSVSTARKR